MSAIPLYDVNFESLSYRDPNGRVFSWDGGLYRTIHRNAATFYRGLFDKGIIEKLIDEGFLVETEPTSLSLGEGDFVVRHKRLPFVSYFFEWAPSMLRDAALHTIDLSLKLAENNLGITDLHTANVIFDGPKPYFVDLTAIEPVDDLNQSLPSYSIQTFRQFFVYPLRLMAKGWGRPTRLLLHDFDYGIHEKEYHELLNCSPYSMVFSKLRQVKHLVPQGGRQLARKVVARATRIAAGTATRSISRVKQLHGLRQEILAVNVDLPRTEWTDYYENDFPSFDDPVTWGNKRKNVVRVLSELKPPTVLDMGSNRGWYSQLAARRGAKVVAFDVVESSVELLYRDVKKSGVNVLPLVMDVKNPSPALGVLNSWLPNATERLRCDLVLCLALTHHLALREYLTFAQISELLSALAKRWLIVEFVPREDYWCKQMWPERVPEYTLDAFQFALSKHFRKVEVMASDGLRKLLICHKEG